ncbi:hypothetical protein FOA52_012333 [Chlamydomonas sp. UWO 241]|nr:hypothetical protein FOA52_012333 [Chlamydomonas sp. UWO 241]
MNLARVGTPRMAAAPQRNGAQASLPVRSRAPARLRLGVVPTVAANHVHVVEMENGAAHAAALAGAPPAVASQPPPAPPGPVLSVMPPPAAYEQLALTGATKARAPAWQMLLQGAQAGAYLSFGATLMLVLGNSMPGLAASNAGLHKLLCALVFPIGLQMIILGGGDLYTGNTFMGPLALCRGHINAAQLAGHWALSYAGNLTGCLAMVVAIGATGVLDGNSMLLKIAETKANLPLGQCLARAVLANWLVCVAVFHATAATSLPGKLMGLWPPITAFIAMGLEHSIANMFLIPMGMFNGANVTVSQMWLNNLLPVTLGNTIAGAVIMTGIYTACYRPRAVPARAA